MINRRYARTARSVFMALALLGLHGTPVVAGPPPAPRVLISPGSRPRAALQAHQAKAQWLRDGASWKLQLSAGARPDWPGVRIVPPAPWDLSSFDRIEIEVENTGAGAATVVLVANNPGADGRSDCSAATGRVAPGETKKLRVEFGKWHGQARSFDRSRVVSLGVLFQKPDMPVRVRVTSFTAIAEDRRTFEEFRVTEAFRKLPPALGAGINLSGLEAPREGAWGLRVEEAYFRAIRQAQFDFIRLPVRWSAHTEDRPPYRIDETFFERIDWAVQQARKHDLSIIVNVHHFDELLKDAERETPRFLAIWKQIAERYANQPNSVLFELLNEPHEPMTAATWNELAGKALAVIRRSNPTRRVVIGPVHWNAVRGLDSLQLPDDLHVIATVHYYLPFRFTHQGATWVGQDTRSWVGTRWEGTRDEKEAIRRDLDQVLRWSLRHGRPMLVGEFGVINKADAASRVRWARFMAAEMAQRKMGYAWWDFGGAFEVYDRRRHQWIEPLRDALLDARRPAD